MGLLHLDLRAWARGGPVSANVAIVGSDGGQLEIPDFRAAVKGRHVVLATHGFNVDAQDGLIALDGWARMADLPDALVFVGVLWPGDSLFLPILDYPMEVPVAMEAAALLAPFLNANCNAATGISLVSHSLGARMVLETARLLGPNQVHTLILMAGAIEDDSLADEYAGVAASVRRIRVIASRRDAVLELAFPLGNPVGELLLRGDPYFREALGREGANPVPLSARDYEHWQIPDTPSDWDYGHLDYMPKAGLPTGRAPTVPRPVSAPKDSDAVPVGDDFTKSEWAAAAIGAQWLSGRP